jgi:hypothetical protein
MDIEISREALENLRSEVLMGDRSDPSGLHANLDDDLQQVWFAHGIGIPSEQLARITGWPVEYVRALSRYLEQEGWLRGR